MLFLTKLLIRWNRKKVIFERGFFFITESLTWEIHSSIHFVWLAPHGFFDPYIVVYRKSLLAAIEVKIHTNRWLLIFLAGEKLSSCFENFNIIYINYHNLKLTDEFSVQPLFEQINSNDFLTV